MCEIKHHKLEIQKERCSSVWNGVMFSVKQYFGNNIIILSCWSVNNWAVYYFFLQIVKGKAVT